MAFFIVFLLIIPPCASFKFLFGSCNNQNKENAFWPIIQNYNDSDLFVWLGDIIYADHAMKFMPFIRTPATEDDIREGYKMLTNNPGYAKIVSTKKIIGIWDDHDYGMDNGHKHFALKSSSLSMFLDFIREPQESIRRQQQGVYMVYRSVVANLSVRIILLDSRYNKDPPPSTNRLTQFFHDSYKGPQDMLGPTQWAWLAEELKTRADLTIIGSGVQVLSDNKYVAESWTKMPGSLAKLLSLLTITDTPALFISGDVHLGELSWLKNPLLGGREFWDATSSGMTHSWGAPMRQFGVRATTPLHRTVGLALRENIGVINVQRNDTGSIEVTFDLLDTAGNIQFSHVLTGSQLGIAPGKYDTTQASACAYADLSSGIPLNHPCRSIFDSCTPPYTFVHRAQAVIGHFLVLGLLVFLVFFPLVFFCAPLACIRCLPYGALWVTWLAIFLSSGFV